MSNELVISSTDQETRIALLQNKNLVEYHVDSNNTEYNVGDLYLGVVKKVVPGLNAAFIDIGYEKDAFLHYLDLGPQVRSLIKFTKAVLNKKEMPALLNGFNFEPEISKLGKVSQVLTKNQKILVQVAKEPISTKGPRLSCEISLAGRYLVLVPFSNVVSVSRKINDSAERQRLKRLITSIKPENFGVIIRTVAAHKEVAELDKDLNNLIDKWKEARKNIKKIAPGEKVLGELNRASSIARDMLNESFDSITVDNEAVYEALKDYIREIAPDKERIVKQHTQKSKLFEIRDIEKQVKSSFGRSVSLQEGGYLIIEHTEALHVVDVNSGNKSNVESDQENTALNVNLQAVEEVARQLRLRDMGGIVVVDFIDMKKPENRKQVYEKMRDLLKKDKAKSVVLPLSKFGLLQITRQRVRPELNIKTSEVCPNCGGSGKISASIAIADVITGNVEHILTKQNESGITLSLHPYLFAYFTQGFPSIRMKWWLKTKKWVKIQKDSSLGMTQFTFQNKMGEYIEIL